MKEMTIKEECFFCRGSGLMITTRCNHAVICNTCQGKGYELKTIREFEEKRKVENITYVYYTCVKPGCLCHCLGKKSNARIKYIDFYNDNYEYKQIDVPDAMRYYNQGVK